MMKLTCFCFLTMIAGTLAGTDEVTCCPPGLFVSIKKVKGKAVCFKPERNDTEPASLDCEFGYGQYPYSNYVFKDDGKVEIVLGINGSSHVDVTNIYCVNEVINVKKNISWKSGLVCFDAEVKIFPYGYIYLVSVVFLALTVIIYSVLSELRDLLGISFINLCGSLAIGLCLFSTITLMGANYDDMNLCAARGFLAYYFLIVSFFWTTAISTQLLLSIRSPSPTEGRCWKTFTWYALFAWGCPLLITICMAIVNFHPGDHVKPGIGLSSCWFDKEESEYILWYWLYSVLAILISVNILIFVYISLFFCRNKFASSQRTMLKYKFFLTLKLFVVMGLYWIIELVELFDKRELVIWTILNIITCLQGVWIFLVIVVFRKRVVRAMHKRGWLACISSSVEKFLANDNEVDDNIIEHTSVPMNER